MSKATEGFIFFFKRILIIANIESPPPTLSIGFELNEGQEYIFNLLSIKIEPSIPFVITKYFKLLFFIYFLALI